MMRKLKSITVLLIGIGSMSGVTQGADEQGQYYVKGLGSQSCEQYLIEMANASATHVMFRSWLNGYLTAYNTFVASTYDIAPASNVDGLANAMESICQNILEAMFASGAQALTDALVPQRQVAAVDSSGGATTAADTGELSMAGVQQALQDQGYFNGDVDGLFGPATGAAIEAYQSDKGLAVTGIPDAQTLRALSQ